jgi:hypothetical protein
VWLSRRLVRILKTSACVWIDMDTQTELETGGLFEARYVAFLKTLTRLRPRLHHIRYHHQQKTPGLVEGTFNTLLERAIDIGAAGRPE